jgi:RNA polymerase sigma-70 factor (ECF subfamily)
MQKIAAVCDETAFASIREVFGFVPNVFRLQTLLPRMIQAEAEIAKAVIFEAHSPPGAAPNKRETRRTWPPSASPLCVSSSSEATLSKARKVCIMLAVAAAVYRNTYCVTAHYQMLRSLGIPEWQLDRIVFDSCRAGLPTLDTALIDFALKLAADAPSVSGKDIEALREHGFADKAILEVILATALSNFFCTLSVGLGASPDFEPRAIPGDDRAPTKDHAYVGSTAGPYLRTVELTPDTFPPFAFFLKRFGFIPNIFRAQTLWPDVLEAEAALVNHVLLPEDFLSRFQKECILLVGSAANLNTYCVAAHSEMLRAMGVSTEQSDQIAVDHRQADLSEANKALLDFALKLTTGEFQSDDIYALRVHGFTHEHILEAVVVTALNNLFNTLQMGLGATPDIEPARAFQAKEVHSPAGAEPLLEPARPDPDAELVIRVQNGDLDAFEELVHRHSRRVYRALVAIIGKHEEAQDVTQETFLKAFEHIGNFQHRSKFSTWLLSIASNNGVQHLRERRPLDRIDDLGDNWAFRPSNVGMWPANPEQLYSQAERRGLVQSGLLKVPSKYRVALVLRDIEQLSTEDAAKALGLGISALKARLWRGRLMLREVLSTHFANRDRKVGL